jgi:phage gp37-like protein
MQEGARVNSLQQQKIRELSKEMLQECAEHAAEAEQLSLTAAVLPPPSVYTARPESPAGSARSPRANSYALQYHRRRLLCPQSP